MQEFTGKVTLKSVNDVKMDWLRFTGVRELSDSNKEKVADDFATWVRSVTGRQFNPLDFRQWQLSDIKECTEAMSCAETQAEMAVEQKVGFENLSER